MSFSNRKSKLKADRFDYERLEPKCLLAGIPVGELNSGVAVSDDATGEGFVFYSEENVHTRFDGIIAANADHFLAGRLVGNQFKYNNNSSWVDFDWRHTDSVIAEVFFDSDKVAIGTAPGFNDHDVWVVPNYFGDVPNEGEFQIFGSNRLGGEQFGAFPTAESRLNQIALASSFYESLHGEFPDLAIFG